MSAGYSDSNLSSFVNSTIGEEDMPLELCLNNKALLKIMGVQNAKELHGLLMKPLFVNIEHGTRLSLHATASGRCSDGLLG